MLEIGVIGTGAIGKEHIQRITDKVSDAQVTVVYDVFAEGAKAAAALCGAKVCDSEDELIAEVDAVVCTSIADAHAETVLKCIAAGKPVFCEKPLAVTAADAKRIVDAEVASGIELRFKLEDELVKLWQRTGTTVLFITHNVEEAVYLSERVMILTNKPTKVKTVLDNPLPRPRDIASPEFIDLRNRVTDLIKWW